tara:strand:+ start:550 stop:936 length:387 start_codon:yes stop_codon:yes gene_type:complete
MFAKSIYPIISINTINNINSQPKFMIKPSNEEIILVASILLETLSTACLKKTLNNKLWFFPVYSGYGLSFFLFPKALNKFSLSSAYSIWCGLGMLLTFIIDKIIYKEIITKQKIAACFIIIYGIKLIK